MILFNKLIRMDLFLVAALLLLICLKNGVLKDALFGFAAVLLVLSTVNHITHYKRYQKFY